MANTTVTIGPRQRQVYVDGDWEGMQDACGPSLLPYLPMLGTSRWDAAQAHGLESHCHSTHEICLIVEGQVTWWVRNPSGEAECITLRRGDGFITQPGEEHGGVDTLMHPCALFWLQVDVPRVAEMSDSGNILTVAFESPLPRYFPTSQSVRAAFETLLAEHGAPSPLGALAAHATLLNLLVSIARDRSRAPVPLPRSPEITMAMAWMQDHLSESFSVGAAARVALLPKARFHERFLAEVGQTPGEWRIRERVTRAQERLRFSEATITEVALSLGFKSSQHFATAFKRYTGQTPSDFRARSVASLQHQCPV